MSSDVKYSVNAGFFDSINKDRNYSADDMNKPYKRLVSNGVFATPKGEASDDLQVFSGNDGMNVIVSAGNAIIGDRWFENPSDLIITIPQNSEVLSRVDSIVAQIDKTQAGRSGNIVYRQGVASSNPVHPEINTEENIFELRLADIIISPSCVKITQDLITDCRGSSDCPWITSLIKQVDTSTLYAQWQAAYQKYYEDQEEEHDEYFAEFKQKFEDWFQEIKGKLSEDEAGRLQLLIDDIQIHLTESDLEYKQEHLRIENIINEETDSLQSQIKSLASGSPLVASSIAEMTDTTRVYVNTMDGYWYTYDGEEWVAREKYTDITDYTEAIEDFSLTKNTLGYSKKNFFENIKMIKNKSMTDKSAINCTITNFESKLIDSEYADISEPIRVRYDNGVDIFNENNWKWNTKGLTDTVAILFGKEGNFLSLLKGDDENIENLPSNCFFVMFKFFHSHSNTITLIHHELEWLNDGKVLKLQPSNLKWKSKKLFDNINFIQNKNLNNSENKTIYNLTNFMQDSSVASLSEPVKVRDNDGTPLFDENTWKWSNNGSDAVVAYAFDYEGNYISRILNIDENKETIIDGAYYYVFVYYSNLDNSIILVNQKVEWINSKEVYYVGPSRENTSFTQLIQSLKDNKNEKVIYVDAGTYDIFQEIGGKDYVDSIVGKTDWSEVSTIIPPNTKIIGIGKVIFNFLPEDDEMQESVGGLLSPINTRGGVTIENITINATNCRYCIHDEVSLLTEYDGLSHIYRNVTANYIKGNVNVSPSGQAFGCGFNSNTNFLFENCTFKTTHPNTPAWSMHDRNSYGNNGSTIICNNCIFISNHNKCASFRNIHSEVAETEILANMNNCYFSTNVNIENDYNEIRTNNFNLTLLNCTKCNIEIGDNMTNNFEPKVYNSIVEEREE